MTAKILMFVRLALSWPRNALKYFLEHIGVLDRTKHLTHRMSDLLLGILITASKPILLRVLRGTLKPVERSLWAGTPIITLEVCARAERLRGTEADSLVFHTYFTTAEFTFNLSSWNRGPALWKNVFLPFAVLMWACVRYQRFHFFFDCGILPTRDFRFNQAELQLLRLLGKEIYFYAYGADVRTRNRTEALGVPNCCTECPNPGKACVCDDRTGVEWIRQLTQLATATFSMGDMIHYTPGSRNDLFYWPIDLDCEEGTRYTPRYPDADSDRPIRIVHAPNHRGFKGTHFLLEAVARLQGDGLPIELILVEGVPNRQALDIYRTADIIFDQCLVGFHGYFALEALAMGKPVMVFIRDPDGYLANARECPFVNTSVEKLESDIKMLTRNRHLLHELGERGRRYIEDHHSMGAFAKRLEKVYEEIHQGERFSSVALSSLTEWSPTKVNTNLKLTHPEKPSLPLRQEKDFVICETTGETFPIRNGIPRLVREIDAGQQQTMDGFSYKWEKTPGFGQTPEHQRVFLQAYREWFGVDTVEDFARFMKGKYLLNAGCGCGRNEFIWGQFPARIVDLDISRAIDVAKKNWGADSRFSFVQADILQMPFADQTFDVVWSEGVLHHTPSTHDALGSCVRVLKPDGLILFYVYRKKAPLREFADDYIRQAIADLPPDQAWTALEPLTRLAKAFSDSGAKVQIHEDVDLLGFKAGTFDVQRFLYYNVMKFYWNDEFTFDENVHINYDWYYPKYCWRHTVQEIREWLAEYGLQELELYEADSGIGVIAKKRAA